MRLPWRRAEYDEFEERIAVPQPERLSIPDEPPEGFATVYEWVVDYNNHHWSRSHDMIDLNEYLVWLERRALQRRSST